MLNWTILSLARFTILWYKGYWRQRMRHVSFFFFVFFGRDLLIGLVACMHMSREYENSWYVIRAPIVHGNGLFILFKWYQIYLFGDISPRVVKFLSRYSQRPAEQKICDTFFLTFAICYMMKRLRIIVSEFVGVIIIINIYLIVDDSSFHGKHFMMIYICVL